jgi:uncharacterized membrane protein YvbJ
MVDMVYCAKCGEKNEDIAKYCSKCGASLTSEKKDYEKNMENRCEEECSGGKDGGLGWRIFWGLVIIVFGLWIIFELVLKNLADDIAELAWVKDIAFPFWWVIGAIFGILIIIAGIKIIIKNK